MPLNGRVKAPEFEKPKIDKMLKMTVIEPDETRWAALIAPTPKMDGSLRFCVGYRRLNAVAVRDSYRMQRMNSALSR